MLSAEDPQAAGPLPLDPAPRRRARAYFRLGSGRKHDQDSAEDHAHERLTHAHRSGRMGTRRVPCSCTRGGPSTHKTRTHASGRRRAPGIRRGTEYIASPHAREPLIPHSTCMHHHLAPQPHPSSIIGMPQHTAHPHQTSSHLACCASQIHLRGAAPDRPHQPLARREHHSPRYAYAHCHASHILRITLARWPCARPRPPLAGRD